MSLHDLAKQGDLEGIWALLDAGAEVNVRDEDQWTPLMHASHLGHKACVRLLLDWGAEVDARDEDQWTPLHFATLGGYEAVAHLLLDAGAEVDARDHLQRTPLHIAAKEGHESCVRLILKAGHGRESCARLLLDRGVEVDARDDCQQTPLYHAFWNGCEAIGRLLLNRGADPFLITNRLPLNRGNPFWGFYLLLEAVRQGRLSKANALFSIASECTLPPEIMLAIWTTAIQMPEKRWLTLI